MVEYKLGEECEHGSLKRQCLICELQEELAALREENERLEIELRCICVNDSRKLDEIKRLRAKAIIWHKWPEEKPVDKTVYLCGEFDVHGDFIWWKGIFLNGEWVNDDEPRYFAQIPRPEGE